MSNSDNSTDSNDNGARDTCHFCEFLGVTFAETDGIISWVCGEHAAQASRIVPAEEVR